MTFKLPDEDLLLQRNLDQIRVTIAEQTRMINQIETNYNSLVEQITEFLINTRQLDEKYLDIMLKADWPPVIDLNYDHARMIIAEYEKEDFDTFKRNLDQRLLEYFCEKVIEKKLSTWREKEILQGRIHILEAIIKAHLNNDFILSIPVMLTQIEGIIAEYFHPKDKREQFPINKLKEYLQVLSSVSEQVSDFKAMGKFIEDQLYKKFYWGFPIPSSLNRHAILHGACIDFDNKINSVKVIVFFDLLLFAFELKERSKDGEHMSTVEE